MDGLVHYLPASIFSFLHENDEKPLKPPFRQTYQTVVLFADVSGYTALCEAMAAKGPTGDEYLAKHLNSYFELLVRTMASQGGDVFKFAGDAMIVLWPPSEDDLTTLTRRAAQCALEINRGLQDIKFEDGSITLAVKVGVGVGKISILHVGGVFGRLEYCATGSPLLQAFAAEHHAVKKEVVVAPEAWTLIKNYFKAEVREDFAFLQDCTVPVKKFSIQMFMKMTKNVKDVVLTNVKKYVPSAVTPYVSTHEEQWASELRRITVLFVNLGLNPRELSTAETQQDLDTVQKVLEAVQFAVYRYEGSLNKFLMDDKGSTLIAVFGLPPLAHEDDAVRGVLSALMICSKLHDLGKCPAIGITTGPAFCGVVGSRGRREYSVLGDTVNLSARLMQHASVLGGGVVVDPHTQFATRGRLSFEDLGKIAVKGKKNPVAIFHPYPKNIAHFFQRPKKKEDDHGHGTTQDGKDLIIGRGQLKSLATLSDKAKAKLGLATGAHEKPAKEEPVAGPPKGLMESIHNSQLMNYADKHFNAIKAGWAAKAKKSVSAASSAMRGSLTVAHGQHSLSITAGAGAAAGAGGISPALMAMAAQSGMRDGAKAASLKELESVAWDNVGTKDSVTATTMASKNDDGSERKMKIRGVKVSVIGSHKGMVNMSLHKYNSVGALKNELWEVLKRRGMVDSHDKKDDWLFQLPGKEFTLSDDMSVDLLSMFSSSLFPALSFVKHPMFGDSLEPIRADIFKRIYTLADTRKGGLVFVEGDMGLGKTKLVFQVIDESPIPVYFGCGNPFEIARQLFSFRETFLQLIDTEIDTVGPAVFKEALPVNRRTCVANHLRQKGTATLNVTYAGEAKDGKEAPKQTAAVTLEALAPVLNDVFALEFPETDVTKGLSKEDRVTHAQALVLAVFQTFSAKSPVIVCFDDAIFMDKASWGLVARLAASENTLVILASRPMNKSYLAAFTSVPPEYAEMTTPAGSLKKLSTCHVIQPRPQELIYNVACEAIGTGIKEMPDVLSRLLADRAQGSPFVVKELVNALKKEGLITVGPNGVNLGAALTVPKPAVQVPVLLQCLLGCRLDKLSVTQQMILKTAAIIGDDFSYDFVSQTYPLALANSDSNLGKEFQALVDLGYVKRLKKVGGGDVKEVMYTFNSGFLRDMLLSRMLKFQKKKLVQKMEEVGAKTLERLDFASQFDRPESISGTLQMLKLNEENKVWETNFYSIRGDVLSYWIDEADSQKEEKRQKPLGVIFLKDATIERYVAPHGTAPVEHALQVNAKAWMRKGDYHSSAHAFKVQAKSADECTKWHTALTQATANEREGKQYITDIHALSEAAKEDLQRNFDKTQMDHPPFKSIIMSEWLWSRKQILQTGLFARNWKKRWVTITDDFFALRKEEMPPNAKFVRPVQAACLTLPVPYQSALEFDKSKGVWTFTVSTPLWVKYAEVQWKMKSFILGHEKQEVAKKWADLIGKTLNKHRAPAAAAAAPVPRPLGAGKPSGKLAKMMGGDAPGAAAPKQAFTDVKTKAPEPAKTPTAGGGASSAASPANHKKEEDDEDLHLKKDTELFGDDDDLKDDYDAKIPPPPPHPRTPSPPPPPPGSETDKVTATANAHVAANGPSSGAPTPTNAGSGYASGSSAPSPSATPRASASTLAGRRGVLQQLDDAIAALDQGSLRPEMFKQMLMGIKQGVMSKGVVSRLPTSGAGAVVVGVNADVFPEDELDDPEVKKQHNDFAPPSIADMVDACDIDSSTKEWLTTTYSKVAHAKREDGSPKNDDDVNITAAVKFVAVENPEKLLSSYLGANVGHLNEWDWNIFAFEKDDLLSSVVQMFSQYGLFKTFAIPGDVFVNFIHSVRKQYYDVPFHNFYHAVDVMQTVYSLLTTFECDKILATPQERLAILVAALCHDLRHPGLNNLYQVNARTPLAVLYNDQAVLEQHHSASTFRILSDPKTNILVNCTPTDYTTIRKHIVNGILATDMTCHFALIEKFSQVLETNAKKAKDAAAAKAAAPGTPSAGASPSGAAAAVVAAPFNDVERSLILNLVLHSADISNPCKPFNTSKRWANLIGEEFFMQGDIEKAAKPPLPVSPNCDRNTTEQSQLTLNFIDFIVAPNYVALRNMLPKVHYICELLGHNRGTWAGMCDKVVAENKSLTEAQKTEEKNRWARRHQTFNTILIPKEHDLAAAQAVKDGRAAEPRRSSIAILDRFCKANAAPSPAASPMVAKKQITVAGAAGAGAAAGTASPANGTKALPAVPGAAGGAAKPKYDRNAPAPPPPPLSQAPANGAAPAVTPSPFGSFRK